MHILASSALLICKLVFIKFRDGILKYLRNVSVQASQFFFSLYQQLVLDINGWFQQLHHCPMGGCGHNKAADKALLVRAITEHYLYIAGPYCPCKAL